jgi:hypothetical protein
VKSPIRNNFLPPVTILSGFAMFLSGCEALPGKQAKPDAVAIQKNDATAQKATQQAQAANDAARQSNQSTGEHLTRAQELLRRIDAKDAIISKGTQ